MKTFRLLSVSSLLLAFLVPRSFVAQRRISPAKAPGKATSSAAPTPSFDNLLAADTYKVYGEIRGAGQLIRSNSVNELLEPIMKLAAPPKEFRTLVKWLNTHADSVMTSRILIAAWPTARNVPDALVVIEFPSSEDAAKFAPQLNEFLPKVIPSRQPDDSSDKSQPQKEKSKPAPPIPGYHLKQEGALLFITSTPLSLTNLRPPGSKPLTEDTNFRTAHDRFSTESIFVYVDFQAIERAEENSRRQAIEEAKKQEKQEKTQVSVRDTKEDVGLIVATQVEPSPQPTPEVTATATPSQPEGSETPVSEAEDQSQPKQILPALYGLLGSFFSGKSKWPQGIGVGLSLENDSFDLRALLVNSPGERGDAVPFVPMLIPGPAITPQLPSMLPADTELFVAMSLDLDQMYMAMNASSSASVKINSTEVPSPFASIEKTLGVKIKEDILPLIGNEVVLTLPMTMLGSKHPTPAPSPDAETAAVAPSPVLGLSLKDKEGMRTLLPKLIDHVGFAAASSMAQTERKEDTELITYGNMLAYAFIGDYLIISTEPKAVRKVVESYVKQETLSSDSHFKNYTRWQPRQLQGQIYVSPALMESYKAWASEPNSLMSDSTRDFLMRLSVIAEPVTYALSNEGFGPLHEVHIPKNLVLIAVAAMAGESSPPPAIANERRAMSAVYTITWAEREYNSKKGGGYATLDQLLAENFVATGTMKTEGYKIEVIASGNQYQITAVPTEYGTTGRMSYFADESGVVRSGDHGGAPATVNDRPVQ